MYISEGIQQTISCSSIDTNIFEQWMILGIVFSLLFSFLRQRISFKNRWLTVTKRKVYVRHELSILVLDFSVYFVIDVDKKRALVMVACSLHLSFVRSYHRQSTVVTQFYSQYLPLPLLRRLSFCFFFFCSASFTWSMFFFFPFFILTIDTQTFIVSSVRALHNHAVQIEQ
jgi:hypothetical protein